MGNSSHGRPRFSRTRRPERLSPREQMSSCPGLEADGARRSVYPQQLQTLPFRTA